MRLTAFEIAVLTCKKELFQIILRLFRRKDTKNQPLKGVLDSRGKRFLSNFAKHCDHRFPFNAL